MYLTESVRSSVESPPEGSRVLGRPPFPANAPNVGTQFSDSFLGWGRRERPLDTEVTAERFIASALGSYVQSWPQDPECLLQTVYKGKKPQNFTKLEAQDDWSRLWPERDVLL